VPSIFVISDGTGRTAQQALEAALTQFDRENVHITRFGSVRSDNQVEAIVNLAKETGAFIIHTLVTDRLRETLFRSARLQNVDNIDLMGPLLHRLSDQLSANPSEKPGLFSVINDSYFRKIEAMQFAFKHDDGKRIEDLQLAEIILVGVSRTFKTPLSIFLAFKGWYVANVPIVLDVPPPEELFRVPPEKIYCLTTYPNRLAVLRRARQERLGGHTGPYSHPEHVKKEIAFANRIFEGQPKWQKINVTSKAIEEISAEILSILPKKPTEDSSIE
jgi:regulator of PEP synthase PpsR (kinase-PPPase family)